MTSSYDIVLVSPKFRRSVSPTTHVFCMNTTTCRRSEAARTLRPLVPPAIVSLRVEAVCIKPLRDEAVCIQSKTNYIDVTDERLWESVRNWSVGDAQRKACMDCPEDQSCSCNYHYSHLSLNKSSPFRIYSIKRKNETTCHK